MRITPLIEAKAELTDGTTPAGSIVLSTRIRLARNLTGAPFPGWAKEAQRRDILSKSLEVIEALPIMEGGSRLTMDELSPLEKQILHERHLISRELMSSRQSCGVYVSGDQSCAIMVNEEDHLRIQMLRSGLKLKQIFNGINGLDDSLELNLDYAFSPQYGYLTACPTNVGTGMRASAMLHLPGLVLSNHMEKVIRMVNQVGLAVRGLFGEGSDATGSVFQISNQQTLGESEKDILGRLQNILQAVITQEDNARKKLMEEAGAKIRDKIGRACGILQNAHLLSSEEALNLLSLMRFAVDVGMLPEGERTRVDRLFIEVQPGHLQYAAGSTIEPNERDPWRARLLREQFDDLPPLNFDGSYNKSE